MRRWTIAFVVGVLWATLATVGVAAPALPGDECTLAPTLVAEIAQDDDGRPRTPRFVGADHVWFGDSVYQSDGTLVGPNPDASPRGEPPQFSDHVLGTEEATWGVVADIFPGASVFTPRGELLFELPIEVHAEAIYEEDVILVADWGAVPAHLERVLLVKEDGTIHELTTDANGFGHFGTVLNGTAYVLMRDGGIGTFDMDGDAGPVLYPDVEFTSITTGNGFLYAYGGLPSGAEGADLALHVLDSSGDRQNLLFLDDMPVRMGPTAGGYAMDVIGDGESVAYAMAPNGYGVLPLQYLHDTTDPKDALAWQHGRYLIGLNVESETDDGIVDARVLLHRLDGEYLGSSELIRYRSWPLGLPVGEVLALVGADGMTVDFRSLSGVLMETIDYSGTATPDIETIDGNGAHVWVTTTDQLFGNLTAHVYDLGDCVGSLDPGRFIDDDGSIFEADIEWLHGEGITLGCNPSEVNTKFCPDGSVTRGQLAAFLVRALGLTDDGGGDLFVDDDGSIFEASIDKLATAGITKGCNPPNNDMFCPTDLVTRGQMAAFLVRAMEYTDDGGGDLFIDDDGNIFESSIDRLATAGVTRGCNPPRNDRFCPDSTVTRGQMAAFLHRALG